MAEQMYLSIQEKRKEAMPLSGIMDRPNQLDDRHQLSSIKSQGVIQSAFENKSTTSITH